MDVVLFHSVYGLRPAVHAGAQRLRDAGHHVHVPDLFEGQTVGSAEEGRALKDTIGSDELLRRAVLAVAPYSERGLVYAGFSFGGSVAQTLALGDSKARGLLLMHGTSDIAENVSVDDLPVQLHVADPDVAEPHDWLNAWYLRMRAVGADVEIYRYRGVGHLYTDPDLPDYDEQAAEQTWRTGLAFVESLADEA